MTTRPIDPVLARQLKRLTLPNELETSPMWQKFLDGVNEHYLHTSEDRALLSRSIELSTHEMDSLRRRTETQRDQLVTVIAGISDSLGQFAKLLHSGADEAAAAKVELAKRLAAILEDSRTTDVSGIRDNLLALADQLIGLLAKAGERASIRKELEVARAVQQLLIPGEAVISLPPLRFAGHFQPAEECGGDWWTVTELPGARSLVVIGDVTGHGIASAIVTGAAKAACELATHVLGDQLTPSALLELMNRTLYNMAREKLMMTAVAAVVDPVMRSLTIANAAHPFPLLVRKSITHPIMAEGPQLGAARDGKFEDTHIEIQAGDVMVYFTDGVSECENAAGERFSERRLRSIVQRAAGDGAVAVRSALVDALTAFRGSHPPTDDLTLVVAAVE